MGGNLITNVMDFMQLFNSPQKHLPDVPEELQHAKRWLQGSVANKTPYDIKYIDTYFDSGKYYADPGHVPANSVMIFSCRNTTGLSGVAGAISFEAEVEGKQLGFIIGFTNPFSGSNKISAVADFHPTRIGYERADDHDCTATSEYGVTYVEGPGKVKRVKLQITAERHGYEPRWFIEAIKEDVHFG